eukprot:4646617-Prymnesium_polylepis.1
MTSTRSRHASAGRAPAPRHPSDKPSPNLRAGHRALTSCAQSRRVAGSLAPLDQCAGCSA